MPCQNATPPVGLFDILGAARRYRAGGTGPKATLLVIVERAGQHDDTGDWTCWPSPRLIAEETEQSAGSVRRHIAQFVDDGVLNRVLRGSAGSGKGGGRKASLLRLNLAKLGLANAHNARSPSDGQRASEGGVNAQTEGVAPYIEHQEEEQEPAPNGARADLLVKAWWEERKAAGNPPAQPFIACRKVVEAVLRNGVSEPRVEWALRHVPVVSSGAIEMAIQREIDRRDPKARDPRPSRQDEAVQRMKARAAERIAEQRGHIIDVHETRGLGA